MSDLGAGRGASTVTVEKGGPPAYHSDAFFYRGVAVVLGSVLVLCVGLGFWAYICPPDRENPEAPDFLIAVASTSVGALAGVFAAGQR